MKRILIASILTLTGCATTSNGGYQDIAIKTINDRDFRSTKCQLENEEGQWVGVPATTVRIHRDGNSMEVSCKNELQTGSTSVQPKFKVGGMVLNLIFDLCIISCVVDGITNALYVYPSNVTVRMDDTDSKSPTISD